MVSSSSDTNSTNTTELWKQQVARKAVDDYVKSGHVVGLGSGSTAYYAVERVGEKLQSGELDNVVCIPASERTKQRAEKLGIPLVTLDTHPTIDVAIEGADKVDRGNLNLIKGGGGALLREKMVEICAEKFVVVVDESKLCSGLGPEFPIPVEITPFCHEHTVRLVADLPTCKGKCKPLLRKKANGSGDDDQKNIVVTDGGNYIVDLFFDKPIEDPPTLAEEIKHVCGVIEHGLFCCEGKHRTVVLIAGKDGITIQKD